ncbi:MAG: extracellular solute-binding protein [Planctomycetota bacterium]|nr:extracellular solute-binding protein [Planctomycetota bacterium]
MDYPPGKAPLAILIMAVVSGVLLLVFPAPKREGNLQVWTFADSHFRAYQKVVPQFEERHPGVKVDLQYVHGRAVTSRLRSAFASDLPVPDLLETEISSAGTFFLGPLEDIGFVDLTEELHKQRPDGPPWIDRVVRSRFAPYTSRRIENGAPKDHIFGLPHDVHPVLLAYRRDVFQAHGIDPETLTTWDKFLSEGRTLMQTMNADLPPDQVDHYLIGLSDTDCGDLEVLLFQRDGGYFDADGTIRMDDDISVQTMCWYVPLVVGPERVGYPVGWNWELTAKAVEKDFLLCYLMPDWLSGFFQKSVRSGTGKLALMPLPAFTPGGRRTSTRGGTMMGFTKKSTQFDISWELALELYFSIDSRIEQFRETNILPPLREAWKHPALAEPNPYWSNQPLGQLYAAQADNTPPQYTSPYIQLAKGKLGEALCDCVDRYKKKGADGFEAYVRERLRQSADEIRGQMKLNPYQ